MSRTATGTRGQVGERQGERRERGGELGGAADPAVPVGGALNVPMRGQVGER